MGTVSPWGCDTVCVSRTAWLLFFVFASARALLFHNPRKVWSQARTGRHSSAQLAQPVTGPPGQRGARVRVSACGPYAFLSYHIRVDLVRVTEVSNLRHSHQSPWGLGCRPAFAFASLLLLLLLLVLPVLVLFRSPAPLRAGFSLVCAPRNATQQNTTQRNATQRFEPRLFARAGCKAKEGGGANVQDVFVSKFGR